MDCSLPHPDPALDEEATDWATLHSLASLRLTLDSIILHCSTPNEPPLSEFPLKTDVDPPLTEYESPLRTMLPRARLCGDKLSLKIGQLKSAIKLYQEHIHKLHQGSVEIFGAVRGRKVCLLVDTSDLHAFGTRDGQCEREDDDKEKGEMEKKEFGECRKNLRWLFEEQLSQKKKVYLLQLGSQESDSTPTALNLREHRERSMMVAGQWIDSLRGCGTCSLLSGLEKALAITDIDTILIVMGSRPNEDRSTLADCVKEKLNGNSKLHVHWVAHGCNNETRDMLAEISSETTGAQFHSYFRSSSTSQQVVDTEVDAVMAQLQQAERVVSELEGLVSGEMSDTVLHTLTQLNIAHTQFKSAPIMTLEQQHPSLSSIEWLKSHSLSAEGLSIYSALSPNSYPQLKTAVTFSPDTHTVVPSVVYDDSMPRFTWHDGTQKYLHVDVHLLEDYQVKVEVYISKLQQRINWLVSGSRAPFGVLTEKSVLLVVECSSATLPIISQLQSSLSRLVEEQLSQTKEFEIIRIGGENCVSWQQGFAQQSPQHLSEAWEWLLSLSPSGSAARLMPALETTLTGDTYHRGSEVGVYLVLNSLPKESIGEICGFVRENIAQANVRVHVIYYRYTPPTTSHAIAGLSFDEECYANDRELTHLLQEIATAGKGRFHSFKGPNLVCGDDIDRLVEELKKAQYHLKMAGKILEDYRTFCRRCVPSPLPPPSPPPRSQPPPLYPRTTITFLSRLNTVTSRKIQRSASDSHLSRRQGHTHRHTRRTKTYSFYLDNKLDKGLAFERAPELSTRCCKKPQRTEFRSISEWLSKYGLEALGLNSSRLEVQKKDKQTQKKAYKHINKKGEIVELYADHHGLRRFLQRVKQVRDSYSAKLEELCKGWHHYYGCISESKVLFLIDVSSSMAGCFQELRTALTDLIHNPPHTLKYFNMAAYSSSVQKWQEALSPATTESLDSVLQWLTQLRADGSSCLLLALKMSLATGAKTVYLVTDGTADHTHEFLISQLPQLRAWYGDNWKINTVAFHCTLESSHEFMKTLAHNTNGRYHSYPWETAAPASQLLQNRFLGDDIKKLATEIVSAEEYIHKASSYI